MSIEVLVVDLGGVAARFTPERRLRALGAATGLSEAEVRARIWDSGLEASAERGRYSSDEIIEVVRAAFDHRIGAEELVEAWALAFEPDEAVLARLARVPLRRVVFTNNGPMLDRCLAGPLRDLAASFEQVICSWHLSAAKPDAGAFEGASDRIGVPGARLLLLDDSAENVAGARACGWEASQVRSLDDLQGALAALGEPAEE